MRNDLAVEFGNIASEAGKIIMSYRGGPIRVELKSDQSPVTEADVNAERAIRVQLKKALPQILILGEESFEEDGGRDLSKQDLPDRFVLVDPLDGTREFTAGRDEFTVNIALIERGVPVLGCVFAPAMGRMYIAGEGAYVGDIEPGTAVRSLTTMRSIRTAEYPGAGLRAVASRSHLDPKTEQLLATLPIGERRPAGSSLKFCIIAEGEADVYPRLAPTMEWDTAAGHAVLSAAGGCVVKLDGQPLSYGKLDTGLRNSAFVAWGQQPFTNPPPPSSP